VGLHSGAEVVLRVARPRPATASRVRPHRPAGVPVGPREASRWSCGSAGRRSPGDHGAEVHTVGTSGLSHGALDHNLLVEITGPECPGMDGSRRAFLDLLDGLGTLEQPGAPAPSRPRRARGPWPGTGTGRSSRPPRGRAVRCRYTPTYPASDIPPQHAYVTSGGRGSAP